MSTIPTQLSFHGNGGSYPPHGVVSADDHGPYVVVATWILMCLMSLSVLARFGLKRSMEKEALAILVASVRLRACLVMPPTLSQLIERGLVGTSHRTKCCYPSGRQPWVGKTYEKS